MRRPRPPPFRCGRLILTPLEVRHKDRLDSKCIGTGVGIVTVLNLVAGQLPRRSRFRLIGGLVNRVTVSGLIQAYNPAPKRKAFLPRP